MLFSEFSFATDALDKFEIKGAILSDHIKSLDSHVRKAKFIAKVPLEIINEVIAKLKRLLFREFSAKFPI